MKKYFAGLNSFERRFVVGALLVVFVVLNLIFVRPLFSDWGKYQERGDKARKTLKSFQEKIALVPELERRVKAMESEGAFVPPEDQANDFIRTIQSQQVTSGVDVKRSVPQSSPRTNTFFLERVQALTLESGEPQLVDFLYRLGAGNSLVRVRGLSLRRDAPGVRLNSDVTLVATGYVVCRLSNRLWWWRLKVQIGGYQSSRSSSWYASGARTRVVAREWSAVSGRYRLIASSWLCTSGGKPHASRGLIADRLQASASRRPMTASTSSGPCSAGAHSNQRASASMGAWKSSALRISRPARATPRRVQGMTSSFPWCWCKNSRSFMGSSGRSIHNVDDVFSGEYGGVRR